MLRSSHVPYLASASQEEGGIHASLLPCNHARNTFLRVILVIEPRFESFTSQEEKRPDKKSELSSPGGEGGIRTLGTLRLTAFRERPVQPLLHLSITPSLTDTQSTRRPKRGRIFFR